MKKTSLFVIAFLAVNVLLTLSANAGDQTAATTDFDTNALVTVMCNALGIITGGTGKTLAAFAVVSLGIGFFLGKVAWGLMLAVALGIAALFGAPTIVNALSGGTGDVCENVGE